jgi:hypothetical protein
MAKTKKKFGGKQQGAGRPKKLLTTEEMDEIAQYAIVQAKDFTIEERMGWNRGFIANRKDIKEFLQQKRAEGKTEVLQAQYDQRKNPTMAIWFGKQHLGQADKQDHAHAFEGITIKIG